MAYLNEFPHFNANTMNLDWILEQYSTFNQRLQELHDHFDEAVAQMEEDIATFKSEYEQAFAEYKIEVASTISTFETQVNSAISAFETQVNGAISAFETQVNGAISEFETQINSEVATISNFLEQISEDVVSFVEQHLSEWSIQATTVDVTVNLTVNTETYGNVGLGTAVSVTERPLILGIYTTTGSGGAPRINHYTPTIKNNDIYPKVDTAWANDEWNVTVYDYKADASEPASRTYTVVYTVV